MKIYTCEYSKLKKKLFCVYCTLCLHGDELAYYTRCISEFCKSDQDKAVPEDKINTINNTPHSFFLSSCGFQYFSSCTHP